MRELGLDEQIRESDSFTAYRTIGLDPAARQTREQTAGPRSPGAERYAARQQAATYGKGINCLFIPRLAPVRAARAGGELAPIGAGFSGVVTAPLVEDRERIASR